MELEVRVAEADDLEPLGRILADAFAFPEQDAGTWLDTSGVAHARVVRDRGEVLGGCLLLPFGQAFGGRVVPMGGVAAVGVKVSARGAGVATALMRAVVDECAGRGMPVSTLFASNQPLYRQAGYEQAGTRFRATMGATALPDFRREGHSVEEVEPGDPRVRELYAAHARLRPGALDRTDYLWRRIELPRGAVWSRGFLVLDPKGVPAGYLWASARRAEGGFYTLDVADVVGATPAAWRVLWSVVRDHATMGRSVAFPSAPTDPFYRALPHPAVDMDLHETWMLRICDAARALRERGYPSGVSADFDLEVHDAGGPAGGRWRVGIAGGRATVEPATSARVQVDVRGLASWYTGFASSQDLRDRGEVEGDDEVIAAIDACFAGPPPWMRDMF